MEEVDLMVAAVAATIMVAPAATHAEAATVVAVDLMVAAVAVIMEAAVAVIMEEVASMVAAVEVTLMEEAVVSMVEAVPIPAEVATVGEVVVDTHQEEVDLVEVSFFKVIIFKNMHCDPIRKERNFKLVYCKHSKNRHKQLC